MNFIPSITINKHTVCILTLMDSLFIEVLHCYPYFCFFQRKRGTVEIIFVVTSKMLEALSNELNPYWTLNTDYRHASVDILWQQLHSPQLSTYQHCKSVRNSKTFLELMTCSRLYSSRNWEYLRVNVEEKKKNQTLKKSSVICDKARNSFAQK